MEKAHEFDFYFTDERLSDAKLARMQLTRKLVHELYPEVQERVSYAMPGFYPKEAKKATQQLFLLMANKDWLGLYGVQGLDETFVQRYGLSTGKGSVQAPYDMNEADFKLLLEAIIELNLERHGFA